MVMLYIVYFPCGIKVQALRGFFIYDFAFNLSLTNNTINCSFICIRYLRFYYVVIDRRGRFFFFFALFIADKIKGLTCE